MSKLKLKKGKQIKDFQAPAVKFNFLRPILIRGGLALAYGLCAFYSFVLYWKYGEWTAFIPMALCVVHFIAAGWTFLKTVEMWNNSRQGLYR